MEGVLLPGLGDVGLEGPQDVCSDERVASAEDWVEAELSLDPGVGGVLPQTGCDLSAVFNRKQTEVAVALCDRGHGDGAAVRVRGYELIFCSA